MNRKDFWESRSEEQSVIHQKNIIIENSYFERFNRYIFTVYKRMTDCAYIYMDKNINKKVLKTDLWDAVIEKERNMLSYLELKFKGNSIWGIDISENLVDKVKKYYPAVECSQLDLTKGNKEFVDFDFIGDYSTLDHIQKEKLGNVFSFYEQCLKKGGVCLCIYYRRSPIVKISDILFRIFKGQGFFEANLEIGQYYFDDSYIDMLLKQRKFVVKKSLYINVLSSFPYFLWKYIPENWIDRMLDQEIAGKKQVVFYFFSSMRGIILERE